MSKLFSLGELTFGGVNQETVTPAVESVTSIDGDLNGQATVELKSIEELTVDRVFTYVESFISLDISKTSTGWVRYRDGVKEEGYYTIKSDDDDILGQRREFREFVKDLFQDKVWEFVFIEDTIGSVNYKTSRILQQLNPIVDDLMDMGIIPQSPIVREDNTVWKKNLRFVSNYKSEIRGEDDKSMIRNALKKMGYGDGTTTFVREDIYDAHGLAVGCITRLKLRSEPEIKRKLRTDITKVYKIEQFSDEYEAFDRANELDRHIENVNFMNIARDLKAAFKNYITELGDDSGVYVISIPTNKVGALLLAKNLNLDYEVSYLVVYQPVTSLKKKKK